MSISSSSSRIGKVIHATRGEERGDDVVDDDVAVRQVLPDLDPVQACSPIGARHADAEQHRAGAASAHEPVAGARLLGQKQRRAVAARGEQHAARGVQHGIGVEAVAARIERLHLGRDVERHAAVGLRPQEAARWSRPGRAARRGAGCWPPGRAASRAPAASGWRSRRSPTTCSATTREMIERKRLTRSFPRPSDSRRRAPCGSSP